MFLTTLGFFALTGIFVGLHLRRRSVSTGAAAGSVPVGVPCPRCEAPVPSASAFCPGCGVPQQIFEVAATSVATGDGPAAEGGVRPHAVVRADMCAGCGTCVPACPEDGAIRLEGKLAVVDRDRCTGAGACVEACPVSAVLLTTGEAVHRVEVPEVGTDFQTNLPGVYIAGELGGRGLIKNAINEGKIAVESVARELPPGEERDDGDADAVDVAIVGAGPAGISAGLEALRSGLSYVVLEQGSLADTIRKYPRHKLLLAEPVKIPLYGELWVADASKETLLEVWETIIANTGLEVKTGHRVESIARDGASFLLKAGDCSVRARRVVLAMGRRGTPRRLGVDGEDLDKVFYDVVEMEAFAGRKVLVVGGGDSAVESALGLANQPGTEVTLSYRGEAFRRIKERNREKLEAARADGRLSVFLTSQLREIQAARVLIDVGGQARVLPNDNVIVRIGGDPPYRFLERLGVRIVQKDIPLEDDRSAGVG